MCLKALQLIMISADNHNITRLLLLTIIVSGKKCSISIIDRQNIPINRQNRLIAHPYYNCLHDIFTVYIVQNIGSKKVR